MEYKKIIKDNYTLHLINTDRFKSISIVLFFTKKFNKNDIKFGGILNKNLMYTSKKYNTKNKMVIKGEELYGISVSSGYTVSGSLECINYSCEFLNPEFTDSTYYEKSLDFFLELLLNPNVKNDSFDSKYYNIVKKDCIAAYESIKDNPSLCAAIEFNKIMYKGSPKEYSLTPSINDINTVNESNLYTFYKALFDGSFNVSICVLGNINDKLINIIDNKFKVLKSSNNKLSFNTDNKRDNKLIEKIDNIDFNQSRLYIGYNLINFTYHELNHVMKVYNTILGTMNDSVLFDIVREKNSLCYNVGSFYTKYNNSLVVYAGINKKNYDKAKDLIIKCVEEMSNENIVNKLFESAKKTINTFINNYYDDGVAQINHYYDSDYESIEDIEEYRNNIDEVKLEEVINLNKKIKLNTVYLLKGEKE